MVKMCDCNTCDTLAKAFVIREERLAKEYMDKGWWPFKRKEKAPQTDWRDDPRYSEEAIAQRQADSTKRFEQFEQDKLAPDKPLNEVEKAKKDKPFHGYNPNKHSRKGGLNAKGRAKFKREEGANLKPPVTEKPSSLKPGSKKAKRRKSFCARMSGVKGPTSKGGKLTPKGAALKRWNC